MSSVRTETETVIKRILPYLERRGYSVTSDIDFETPVKLEERQKRGFVDLFVTCGSRKPKFLIEAKKLAKPLSDRDREQVLEYGRAAQVPFVVVTNGRAIQCLNVKNGSLIRWDGQSVDKIPSKAQLALVMRTLNADPTATEVPLERRGDDTTLPFRPGLSLKQLNALFSRCHNKIRNIEKDEENAFADFSKLLFLKLIEEKSEDPYENFPLPYSYRFHRLAAMQESDSDQVRNAIESMLTSIRKDKSYGDVMAEPIRLKNPRTFHEIVKELSSVSFTDSGLDSKGAAFEYFVRATLKGKRLGQYFTPRPLVEIMSEIAVGSKVVNALLASEEVKLLDPACGTGGFLVYLLKDSTERLRQRLDDGQILDSTYKRIVEKIRKEVFHGGDANEGVASAAKMNMIIAGDGHTNITAGDSLSSASTIWSFVDPKYDLILTNPPFGTSEASTLTPSDRGAYPVGTTTRGQYLFLQRMTLATKPGGIIATVIDEGLLNTETGSELRRWILQKNRIISVLRLPDETFKPNKITVRSSVLFMQRRETDDVDLQDDYSITFCDLDSLGYTGAGDKLRGFDLPRLKAELAARIGMRNSDKIDRGYHWKAYDVSSSLIAASPSYRLDLKHWDPLARGHAQELKAAGALTLGELNRIETRRGKSPSPESYVDDFDGYAVVIKAGSCITKYGTLSLSGADYVEKDTYDEMPGRAKVQAGDVLLASTGEGTLGKATVYDLSAPAIADGHVTVLRVDHEVIDPYYLADYLRCGFGAVQIRQLFTGATNMIELTPDHVTSIVVDMKSTVSEQKEYSDRLRSAENAYLASLTSATERLDLARSTFTGSMTFEEVKAALPYVAQQRTALSQNVDAVDVVTHWQEALPDAP
ncbi:N-6 DNA methylase [Streptomyces sp. CRN 30]|uniref:N-6 DNA methylase n=1 Tax=Streptomyces sp. CRN 30 TaxID=3075613 RepID=UPI002A8109DC|nr:N-6 DNA methylase [Streptomyces sp. CRN 30]